MGAPVTRVSACRELRKSTVLEARGIQLCESRASGLLWLVRNGAFQLMRNGHGNLRRLYTNKEIHVDFRQTWVSIARAEVHGE